MSEIKLQVRYQRDATDEGVRYSEDNFERAFLDWTMKSEEIALVMVDCWNIHPIVTHQERAEKICRERIDRGHSCALTGAGEAVPAVDEVRHGRGVVRDAGRAAGVASAGVPLERGRLRAVREDARASTQALAGRGPGQARDH